MQTPIRMPICFLFVWVCVSTPPTVIAADGDTDKVIWFAPHQTQIEECHQWTAIFWEWRETGIVPANAINFHWSIEPGSKFNPLQPSIVIFTELYADLLDSDYIIWDLLSHDPQVLAAFKHHSLTGEVITDATTPATIIHLDFIQNAWNTISMDEECAAVSAEYSSNGGFELVDNFGRLALLSKITVLTKIETCPLILTDGDESHDPPWLGLKQKIRQLIEDSKLPHTRPCYRSDSLFPWGPPGFDCDDYADMLNELLRHSLQNDYPDLEVNFLWLTWWGDGHAMTVFRSGGFYYVIDPQSGQVRGPFSDWNNMRSGAWQLLREISDPSMNDPYLPATEIRRTRTIVEPQPWYTDPLLKQQVLDCLGITNPGLYLPDIS